MKNIILVFLFFSTYYSFGQKYTTNSKFLKSGKIKIDSIMVTFSIYEDRIETESFFEKSKSKLNVNYSKNSNLFNEINTIENNFKFKNCYLSHSFYLENETITIGEEMHYMDQSLHGIEGIFEETKAIYNKSLNSDFLQSYVLQLYKRLLN